MRVGIVGFGFVGRGIYAMMKDAHDVVYYDRNGNTNCGGMHGINKSDIVIVCVNTPQGPDGHANVDSVDDVVGTVTPELVVIKSTVPPGTTDRLSKKHGRPLHFSPEYMGEGKQFTAPWRSPDPKDARSHDFCIVGGPADTRGAVLDVFASVMANDARYFGTDAKTAELVKYMENAYLATKVAFMYEFAGIAEAMGVPFHELRELWLLDPRMGRSHTMVLPDQGGYAGKCLPKDMAALIAAAADHKFGAHLMAAVQAINSERVERAVEYGLIRENQFTLPSHSVSEFGREFLRDLNGIATNEELLRAHMTAAHPDVFCVEQGASDK